jgi:hypothetical protein
VIALLRRKSIGETYNRRSKLPRRIYLSVVGKSAICYETLICVGTSWQYVSVFELSGRLLRIMHPDICCYDFLMVMCFWAIGKIAESCRTIICVDTSC